jgi:hypothetical protein
MLLYREMGDKEPLRCASPHLNILAGKRVVVAVDTQPVVSVSAKELIRLRR